MKIRQEGNEKWRWRWNGDKGKSNGTEGNEAKGKKAEMVKGGEMEAEWK